MNEAIGAGIAVGIGLSSWALLKLVAITERVVALETKHEWNREELTEIKKHLENISDKMDRISLKVGVSKRDVGD